MSKLLTGDKIFEAAMDTTAELHTRLSYSPRLSRQIDEKQKRLEVQMALALNMGDVKAIGRIQKKMSRLERFEDAMRDEGYRVEARTLKRSRLISWLRQGEKRRARKTARKGVAV